MATNIVFAQKVVIYYDNPSLRVIDVPTYCFHGCINGEENKIEITDTVFLSYLSKVIESMSRCDSLCCESYVWMGMIQMVFVRSPYEYDVINMTHGLYRLNDEGHYSDNGCLELNGKIMKYNDEFQEVIDNIVNYHIVNKNYNINNGFFLKSVIDGKRFNLTPYPPSFPIKNNKKSH